MRNGKEWQQENRLVIFTEYKTTLDYLEQRLKETFKTDLQAIQVLFGGMTDQQREEIKQAFNDPNQPVRILLATDAASEGLNLQETAHLVLHYDIPWNPARLDQRNGRLDRHGQARDVIVFRFTSEDDADLKFLGQVVTKVNTIREELGSMGEVFDAAFVRRFTDLEDTDRVLYGLDQAVSTHRENILEIALGLGIGLPRFEGSDSQGRLRLRIPIPPKWEALIDDHLRLETNNGHRGAIPVLVFDPQHFIQSRNGRPVFRPANDTTLLHLGHPLFHQALAMFARARFPGGLDHLTFSRWTVRYGEIPPKADALLLLTVGKLAVNELRESFHHWVRTVRYPIKNSELGEVLPHIPAGVDYPLAQEPSPRDIQRAQDLWDEISPDVKQVLKDLVKDLTKQLKDQLSEKGKLALKEETERFKNRIKEVEKAMQ